MRSELAILATVALLSGSPGGVAVAQVPGELRLEGGRSGPSLSLLQEDHDPLPPDEELRKREIPTATRELIDKLGASSFAERRAATEALLGDKVKLEDLFAALARPDLGAEQRHRLLAITTDRIVNAPRGALGIRMDMVRPGEGGVRVTGLVPGMPAEKHLEVDDLVVAIDGKALRDRDDLVAVVQGLAPGTEVRVEALRADRDNRGKPKLDAEGKPLTKRIDVRFPLGSTRDLARDEDRQGALVANPITGQRLELARAVIRRYAPAPVVVRVPEDRSTVERLAQQSPDIHPDVQAILRWREIIASQGNHWDANTVNMLQATLEHLKRQAEDPSLSDAEREWYGRVAKRYAELMPRAE